MDHTQLDFKNMSEDDFMKLLNQNFTTQNTEISSRCKTLLDSKKTLDSTKSNLENFMSDKIKLKKESVNNQQQIALKEELDLKAHHSKLESQFKTLWNNNSNRMTNSNKSLLNFEDQEIQKLQNDIIQITNEITQNQQKETAMINQFKHAEYEMLIKQGLVYQIAGLKGFGNVNKEQKDVTYENTGKENRSQNQMYRAVYSKDQNGLNGQIIRVVVGPSNVVRESVWKRL